MSLTSTDIANRALQRVGAKRIAAGLLATEDTKNAAEVRACYDILRRAELRRNVWRFSIRIAALRACDEDSRLVTFGTWAIGTTYAANDIVTGSDGQIYQSLVATNLAHDPTTDLVRWVIYNGPLTATLHDTTISYYAGELVYISSTVYVSKITGNEDTPPSSNWMTMGTAPTIAALNIVYPLGSGPSSQAATANIYRLPNGFLRTAPQSPKAGSQQWLGAPTGLTYDDWVFGDQYFTSSETGPIIFRFAADIENATQFDPLFVEGFAARIALEVCEPLTQSTTKLQAIASEYKQFMGDARIVNGIETGPTEPPEDSYITSQR